MKVLYIVLFVISFSVGMIFSYLSPMEYKTVVVYPSPSNVDKIQYKDKTNQCFQFSAKLVDCTKEVKKIPVQ
jgi:hypothetical protein